ncbi:MULTISPECIES: NAD(P)H-dependent glycerol-3-phosphate dehydrogenase [unclassified Shinella]|uniref:NAD(P)H-dependent glycerol-3-phosphate dehydrogenase n=1 Tax=unclassified Shinella TaxID=2643062 RepID=UPI00225D8CEA|nr:MULTISPECIES: NAD(P)H-dependent glycerol-3-phosphate dehydrogenase [unclassified Shinella]MCO5140018.1 NAD(P)-dependent glycerol-3-phosphate dehydrogenase [Shinella sp.]MDC7256964.1 NAD(P)-dependent glycerol-3-phosphate dehydrogenase [Shinella sp. YE25]CAI0339857.1 Glycerol-3-phosphate dehydrogenase (NAD(P)+) [Rhizobiaceae bacterium]CAK7258247.1 Glycerol-3-phosphate dehydrogenase [NAD(P)+] [Shinella sp. WSC3-e]
MSTTPRIAVIGAGAFGTALASVAAASGGDATLIGRDAVAVDLMRASRRNEKALPGIDLPPTLSFSADAEAIRGAGIVLFAMPSQAQRAAARSLAALLAPGMAVVICAKGMEKGTGRLLTEVLEEELPGREIAVLSGPGFAADIAKGLPTAMVIAARTAETGALLAQALSGPTFRLYPSTDRIGVQLGGALKNVLAIACGIIEGAELGDSARAALISRGLAELSRFVAAHGGEGTTVTGLSGLGDLVLTGTSHQSRNLRFGIALGRHGDAAGWSGDLVEGAFAASVASSVAAEKGIDMPITDAVARIIDGSLDVKTAIGQLMTRPITQE